MPAGHTPEPDVDRRVASVEKCVEVGGEGLVSGVEEPVARHGRGFRPVGRRGDDVRADRVENRDRVARRRVEDVGAPGREPPLGAPAAEVRGEKAPGHREREPIRRPVVEAGAGGEADGRERGRRDELGGERAEHGRDAEGLGVVDGARHLDVVDDEVGVGLAGGGPAVGDERSLDPLRLARQPDAGRDRRPELTHVLDEPRLSVDQVEQVVGKRREAESVLAREGLEPGARVERRAVPRRLEPGAQRDVGLDVAARADRREENVHAKGYAPARKMSSAGTALLSQAGPREPEA